MVRHPSSERNDALAHATRWLNLEIISLSEKSQTREATRPLDPFMRTGQRQAVVERKRITGRQRQQGGGTREATAK